MADYQPGCNGELPAAPQTSKQYLAIRQIANEMAQHASLKRPGSLVGEWATRLQEALRSAAETEGMQP